MKKSIFILVFTLLISKVGFAKFEGDLVLEPVGCEETRKCTIKNSLRYTAPNNLVWEAKEGLVTDGASIPSWAQRFIGKPYDKSYIKAAVIHDHYCKRHVRTWRSTHRVFYQMLRSSGVPVVKSKIMYYAVYIGGPKWINLVKPEYCGEGCIQSFNKLPEGSVSRYTSEKYSEISDLQERLDQFEKLLQENDLSLDEIDTHAEKEDADNYYFTHPATKFYNPATDNPTSIM